MENPSNISSDQGVVWLQMPTMYCFYFFKKVIFLTASVDFYLDMLT